MTRRDLKLPPIGRSEPYPPGDRVERAEIEVPAVLVRLAAVEHRALDGPRTTIDCRGDDAERNVRRIEDMMREGGERILSGRRTMHESHRPERGLAREPAGNREAGTAS